MTQIRARFKLVTKEIKQRVAYAKPIVPKVPEPEETVDGLRDITRADITAMIKTFQDMADDGTVAKRNLMNRVMGLTSENEEQPAATESFQNARAPAKAPQMENDTALAKNVAPDQLAAPKNAKEDEAVKVNTVPAQIEDAQMSDADQEGAAGIKRKRDEDESAQPESNVAQAQEDETEQPKKKRKLESQEPPTPDVEMPDVDQSVYEKTENFIDGILNTGDAQQPVQAQSAVSEPLDTSEHGEATKKDQGANVDQVQGDDGDNSIEDPQSLTAEATEGSDQARDAVVQVQPAADAMRVDSPTIEEVAKVPSPTNVQPIFGAQPNRPYKTTYVLVIVDKNRKDSDQDDAAQKNVYAETEQSEEEPTGPKCTLTKSVHRRVSKKMKVKRRHFHPLTAHRVFCPWKIPGLGRDSPAWKSCLDALKTRADMESAIKVPDMDTLLSQVAAIDKTLQMFARKT